MKKNTTNANTVGLEAGTLKTEDIATATLANAVTKDTIDEFTKRYLAMANGENSFTDNATAERLDRLGFKSCANLQLQKSLEAFHVTHPLSAEYEREYPNSYFLPYQALRLVLKSMDLWLDLPEFYAGAVPEEQIPWIEIFERHSNHTPDTDDFCELIVGDGVNDLGKIQRDVREFFYYRSNDLKKLSERFHEFQSKMFVVAPPEAFTTNSDWRERVLRELEPHEEPATPPEDPLVVQPVKGGVIVIAAWGDEAKLINQLNQKLS